MTPKPLDLEAIKERAANAYQMFGSGLWAQQDVTDLLVEITRLRALLAESEWRPIENAPKDVWLVVAGGDTIPWYMARGHEFKEIPGRVFWDDRDNWPCDPTHFRLITPPKV